MKLNIQVEFDDRLLHPGQWARRPRALLLLLAVGLTPLAVYAAVSKPYTFSDGATISASQVNANFDTVYAATNANTDAISNIQISESGLKEELMPSTCPSGTTLGGVAGTESAFCIENSERGAATYYAAVQACSAVGRHVCSLNQWWVGSTLSGVSGMCNNNWEWVSDRDDANSGGHLQVIVGGNGCITQSWGWAGEHNNYSGPYTYRCCKGTISALFD